MFEFDDMLIAEAVIPGIVLGYVECICSDCGCEYQSNYADEQDEYDCPNCNTSNYPV